MTKKKNNLKAVYMSAIAGIGTLATGVYSSFALTATSTANDLASAGGTLVETAIDATLSFISNTSLITTLAIAALFMFFWRKFKSWI